MTSEKIEVITTLETEVNSRIKYTTGTSLVVQRLRLCVPNAGAQVRFLVKKLDPTC